MTFKELIATFSPEAKKVLQKLAVVYGPTLIHAIESNLGDTEKRLLAKLVYKATIYTLHQAGVSTPIDMKTKLRKFLCSFLKIASF